jgi:excisionase family DNA binding protein
MDQNNKLISISKAAKYLGLSVMTLRRWDESGKLPALKSPGGHRYYQLETLELFNDELFGLAKVWAASQMAPSVPKSYYSDTQDRFRARLETMAILMSKDPATSEAAPLVTAIAGEIGNNSFDHNLGNWPDLPGIFFAYDTNKRIVVLADRGIGIRSTLSRIRPDLKDDITTLTVAMTELVSGRSPEQRGNGLKFVRNVATDNPIGVSLQSGIAVAKIDKEIKPMKITLADQNIRGVITMIEY